MKTHSLRLRAKSALLGATLAAGVLVPLAQAPAFAVINGSVDGTVSDADGFPLTGICVAAFDLDGVRSGQPAGSVEVSTDPSGYYFLGGLGSGTYKLRFRDCYDFNLGELEDDDYATTWSGGAISFQAASSVAISAADAADVDEDIFGNTTGDKVVDATMGPDATMAGTIRDDVDNTALGGVCVQVYDTASGALVSETASLFGNTTTVGGYSFRSLPGGSFKVLFRDDLANCGSLDRPAGSETDENRNRNEPVASDLNTHANEYFDNVASLASATTVVLPVNGGAASPIDAKLARISQTQGVRGTVTDDANAAVGGVCVTAYQDPSSLLPGQTAKIASTTTSLSGAYQLALSPTGQYYLEVHERCASTLPGPSDDLYVAEFFDGFAYADNNAPTKTNPTFSEFAEKPPTSARITVSQNAFTTANPKVAKRGAIQGKVTDEAPTPGNLGGVCVVALEGPGASTNPVPSAITATDGTYTVANLRPGTYVVQFRPVDAARTAPSNPGLCEGDQTRSGFLSEYFDSQTARSTANAVVVANGATVTGRGASLRASGVTQTISGKITDAAGLAFSDVCVNVLDLDGVVQGSGVSGTDGTYTTSGVPAGQYKIEFARPDTCAGSTTTTAPGDAKYIATEYHLNSATSTGGTTVTVSTAPITGIDAQVEPGARIAGAVSGASGEEICVELTTTAGAVRRSTVTTSGYAFDGVQPGQYFVRFDDRDPNGTCGAIAFADTTDNYRTEWFDDKFSQTDATPITLNAGTNRQAVNATMNTAASTTKSFRSLSGYVENGSASSARKPINGIKVDLFRFNQDPAIDAPVFSTTTGQRTQEMTVRQCATTKIPDPDSGEPFDTEERPARCDAEDYELNLKTIVTQGYWEISDATQPGGPEALVTGSYKVRFSDPRGLHATEWHRSQPTFEAAQSVPLGQNQVVEIGERTLDHDDYNVDETDDWDDRPLAPADAGDKTDPDDTPQCRYVNRETCPIDTLPNAITAGSAEFVTDLALAGTIDGTVTVDGSGAAVNRARVDLLQEETGQIVASAFTSTSGAYRILGVTPGGYRVKFTPEQANLATEFYNDKKTFGAADIVAVGASTTRSAVDAALAKNDPPVAANDTVQAEINKTTVLRTLTSNDTDPNGDSVSITSVTQPTPHGSVVLNTDGTVSFTAGTDRDDTATFTYVASDPGGLTSTATVTVEMVGQIIGLPPIANDDETTTPKNTAVTIDVLANDSDPDGTAPLTITSVGVPFHGTAVLQGTAIRYTPTTGFSGLDQFVYEVKDAQGFRASAKVTVAVDSSNTGGASTTVAPGGTAATDGTTANADNPIITTVTSPKGGTVRITEEKTSSGKAGDITLVNWRVDITAPDNTASTPLTITFRLDGTLLQGLQPHRAIRVLRNGTLVGDCLGSAVASPDPCISGHRMLGDDVLLTIKSSKASLWNFGFDNDAVVDRASGPSGTGRVGTAVDVARQAFSPNEVDTVLVARKDAYPDALAGAPLAHQLGAPLLLTTSDSLDTITRDEIARLGASRVVILGGTSAVSAGVENQLRGISGVQQVERIRGANRYETAARIAERLGSYDTAYVVEGFDGDASRGWPDAVSVASLAAFEGRPIFLVTTEALPAETRSALSGLRQAIVIGGTASVSTAVVTEIDKVVGTVGRVRGTNRYETSYEVAKRAQAAGMSASSVWLATGLNFPDALAAGAAVAKEGGILLLVQGKDYDASPSVNRFLTANRTSIEVVTLTGGTAAISAGVQSRVAQATTN